MTRSKRSRLLVVASILILLVAIIFQLLSLKVSSYLDVFYEVFLNIAILSSVITVGYIISSGEIRKIQGVILITVYFLVVGHIVFRSFFEYKQTYGAHHWQVDNSSKLLLKVGSALLSCENKVGRFPDSNDWCDLVLKKDVDLSDWHFNPSGRLDNSCGFAFNKNLSELSVDSLAPNTVLIFEADGPWNFAGKQEQFPGTRYRDKYFPKKERFAFIFYVDATLAKYRLYDGSVALYIKDKKTFSDWHEKGETLYSPLKWK